MTFDASIERLLTIVNNWNEKIEKLRLEGCGRYLVHKNSLFFRLCFIDLRLLEKWFLSLSFSLIIFIYFLHSTHFLFLPTFYFTCTLFHFFHIRRNLRVTRGISSEKLFTPKMNFFKEYILRRSSCTRLKKIAERNYNNKIGKPRS